MGTTYTVNVPHLRATDRDVVEQQINQRLQQINRSMSTYQTDSYISRFNRSESTDWFSVPESFIVVSLAAVDVAQRSNGAFDPTVAPLVNLWGFGPSAEQEIPTEEQILQVKAVVGYRHLQVRQAPSAVRKTIPQLQLDFSAIAKGYAVDQLAQIVEEHRYQNYLVEIGGELRAVGRNHRSKPWKIGVEYPDADGTTVNTSLQLVAGGVASSGDYRNFLVANGKRHSHIIDPRSGNSVVHKTAAVTTVANTAMLADAWSTAMMVLGFEEGMKIAVNNSLAVQIVTHEGDEFSVHESAMFSQLKSTSH